jgi:hypothetical protein
MLCHGAVRINFIVGARAGVDSPAGYADDARFPHARSFEAGRHNAGRHRHGRSADGVGFVMIGAAAWNSFCAALFAGKLEFGNFRCWSCCRLS